MTAIEPPARGLSPGDDMTAYRAAVDEALRAGSDIWGEPLLELPDGPTYASLADYLTPIRYCDRTYQTETGVHYLVCTNRVDGSSFALHVADGSQIIAEYTNLWGAPDWALPFPEPPRGGTQVLVHDLLVGADARELFGTHRGEHVDPELAEGWLPIVRNDYVDSSGAQWRRESFVPADPSDANIASMLRLELAAATGTCSVVVRSRAESTVTARFELAPGEHLNVRLANDSTSVERVDDATYDAAREQTRSYWHDVIAGGSRLRVPEPLVLDAWRNVITQNLVLGERYSIGNPYETTFLMEAHGACLALLRWGFTGRATECLDKLADMTNGSGSEWYESWERGVKMACAAEHARLAGDSTLVDKHLSAYLDYLADFARQRASDPHALLAPERYAWDIPEVVYGWHSQAVAWRGAHDLLLLLADRPDTAELVGKHRIEIDGLREALTAATEASVTRLDDGSSFVPVALFSDEAPHEHLTATRSANYWNLVAPYALATGIVEPGGALAQGLLDYQARHGAWLLGLTRFNGLYDPPTPIGTWREDGTAGYCAPGIDNAFGVQTLFFLADNGQADRLALAFYAKLAHGMTRNTFVDGEATTIGVRADEFHRSTWYPPNGTSNAMFLEALRLLLMRELRDEQCAPRGLELAWATPRHWLDSDAGVGVERLPTSFGAVSFLIEPQFAANMVHVHVDPPEQHTRTRLHLRLPVAWQVDPSFGADGWDADAGILDVAPGTPTDLDIPVRRAAAT